MIDVHPPEHPAHSWSDFFIHMGTICLGLLIAIGLEQGVEWMHMRQRVAETREALRKELAVNHKAYRANAASFRFDAAALRNDLKTLLYLRDHPGTAESDLPGVIALGASHIQAAESAWDAGKQTGIVEHLPLDEVTTTELIYINLRSGDELHSQYWECISHAGRYRMVDPDITHLSREDLLKEIDLIEECSDINRRVGTELMNLASIRSDFVGGPTREEVQAVYVLRTPEQEKRLAAATERTMSSVDALREKQTEAINDALREFVDSSKH